jgi:hypothetical protein
MNLDKPRRVFVSDRNFMSEVEIALIGRIPEGRFVEYYEPSAGHWRREMMAQGEEIRKPTLALDAEDAFELYRELQNFFSNKGMKTKQESFIEGELTGTKRHLTDLRHLLKLPEAK